MSLQVYNTYFDGHTELDSGDMCAGIQLASHVYRKRSFTGRSV